MNSIFVTGIGTDVGKTIAAAILVEALQADYWKPVQAGYDDGTDAEFIRSIIDNDKTVIHSESYKLKLAASPHIAARKENLTIDLNKLQSDYLHIIQKKGDKNLIIEGAGGLMVPLNENEFVLDFVKKLETKVILVSRNYLGSINHSLLTAKVGNENNINVIGWIFNDHYLNYENEIVKWSGYPKLASIPFAENVSKEFIKEEALKLKASLASYL